MCSCGDSAVFECADGMEWCCFFRGKCDAGVCNAAVDVCNLKSGLGGLVRKMCNEKTDNRIYDQLLQRLRQVSNRSRLEVCYSKFALRR
jgi:hypothetical protein